MKTQAINYSGVLCRLKDLIIELLYRSRQVDNFVKVAMYTAIWANARDFCTERICAKAYFKHPY